MTVSAFVGWWFALRVQQVPPTCVPMPPESPPMLHCARSATLRVRFPRVVQASERLMVKKILFIIGREGGARSVELMILGASTR